MGDILLSYRTEEQVTADALASHLVEAGLSVRLGTRLSEENPTEKEIQLNEEEIDDADCVVTLWSRGASGSRNVLIEAQRAASQRKPVIADLQNIPLPPTISGQPLVDLSSWLVTRQAAELGPFESAINKAVERVRNAQRTLGPDIYLAYVRANEDVAEAILNMIEHAGYDVWWAPRDLAPGVLWEREIKYAFTGAKLVVLLVTKIAFSSMFVMIYVEMARERGIPVVVAELEPIALKDYPLSLRNVEPVKIWRWHTSNDEADLKPLLDSIRAQITPSRKKKSSSEREPLNGETAKQRAGHDVLSVTNGKKGRGLIPT